MRDHQCLAQPELLGSVEAERVQVASHATHDDLISFTARISLFYIALECFCLGGGGDSDATSNRCIAVARL